MLVTDLLVPNNHALERLLSVPASGAPHVVVMSGALDSPELADFAERLASGHVIAKPFRARHLVQLIAQISGTPSPDISLRS